MKCAVISMLTAFLMLLASGDRTKMYTCRVQIYFDDSWPADEADEIKDIYFATGFFFKTYYQMKNLALKDGRTYRLNADSFAE